VFDGEGGPPVRADVGLRGDRVAAVGDLAGAPAAEVVDAAGLAVCPGFIDTHTHSDMACFLGSGAAHAHVQTGTTRQGVTTEIAGNCGFSPFPFLEERRADVERHVGTLFGPSRLGWNDMAGYGEAVRAAGIHSNLAPLVGLGSVRAGVVGFAARHATDEELGKMERLVEQSLEQGAVGVSSGLIYAPGLYAPTDELVRLARVAGARGRAYATHMRGETDMVADSVREALLIGRAAGVGVHISHHKVAGKANWGRSDETLGMIEAARGEGRDVTLDVYPYTSGSTLLYAMLPPWVQDGGVAAMLERLGDAEVRRRIRADFADGPPGWENLQRACGWDGIVIATCPGRPDAEGRTVVELASDAGKDEADYVFDLLREQSGRVTMIVHMMAEPDVRNVLSYGGAVVGSDGIPLPGKPHPRWAGTFSRVLGRYAREQSLFEVGRAVHMMTAASADRFGLRDRGRLAAGKAADVVVLDMATVIDRATYDDPLRSPDGVRDVFVNGVRVVSAGELTGPRPGRLLAAS
jgi:N-acyl-D-amino-acid deacylase